jgi:ACT domain-containing protein
MTTTLNSESNSEEIDKIVVTVIGGDRTGIVAGVSQVLAECEVNIEDMSSTILHHKNTNLFSMILLGDISNATVPLKGLKDRLGQKGEELGVHIFVLHEEVFNFMNRV